MANADAASSISVTVRVRPFTVREAAQLTKCDEGPLFLGDGSLAAVPTPKLTAKGLRSVIKVMDDKCLYDNNTFQPHRLMLILLQSLRSPGGQSRSAFLQIRRTHRQESQGSNVRI